MNGLSEALSAFASSIVAVGGTVYYLGRRQDKRNDVQDEKIEGKVPQSLCNERQQNIIKKLDESTETGTKIAEAVQGLGIQFGKIDTKVEILLENGRKKT